MASTVSSSLDPAGGSRRSYRQNVQAALEWTRRHSWVLLPFIALPAFWPFVTIGLVGGSDTEAAVIRLAMLDHQVQRGVLYPRIVPEFATGLGYPLYSFYSLVSFYLGELFHLVGLDYTGAVSATYVALMLIGGFGVYLLAREVFGREQGWAALLAAVVYVYSPYLLLNVYVRGGYPEVGGQAMLPWAVWSVRRLITAERPGSYVLVAALSLAGLAVAHILTLFLAVPFLMGYIAVVWWQNGRRVSRLSWIALGVVAGAGLSAFFWLPLIAERGYLSDFPYQIASQKFLPENVWRWTNFLDKGFFFRYVADIPFKLGIVQVALAVVGIVAARRRDAEWLYLIGATVLAGVSMGAWALPIWLSSRILVSIEFTWRLLTIMSVPLALFTGAIVLRVRRPGYQLALSALVALVVIVAQRPQLPGATRLTVEDPAIPLPWIAQFEDKTGALGIGYLQGLLPRWTTGNRYKPAEDIPAGQAVVAVDRANSLGFEGSVSSPAGEPLRFTAYYFPGWRVYLDGVEAPTYPTTNIGLLTVDVPPGEHQLRLVWGGTAVQKVANLLSVLALVGLIVITWRYGARRWLAAVPLVLLIAGLFVIFWRPPLVDVQSPPEIADSDKVTLLGYRTERVGDRYFYVYPYWYVRETPSRTTRVHWQLFDQAGRLAGVSLTRPFFDSYDASNWPPGTLVDDAYAFTLAPDVLARIDSYTLAAKVEGIEEGCPSEEPARDQPGASVSAPYEPAHPAVVRFGDRIFLEGYDFGVNSLPVLPSDDLAVARPGDYLEFILTWQGLEPMDSDYKGFVHLVDAKGRTLAQEDHPAGSSYRPTSLWCGSEQQLDRYELRVPKHAPSGVYWPTIGAYHPDTIDLLPVQSEQGELLGDVYKLPPVKILAADSSPRPREKVVARIGDFAMLKGYDLELPAGGLRPGSQFTVTLYYDGQARTPQDLTRFVHFLNPALGMAAQVDSQPDGGGNPTWSWVPGEVIVDPVRLTVAADAAPGAYSLRVGLYDPTTGARVPLYDGAGQPLPDNQALLTELRVAE